MTNTTTNTMSISSTSFHNIDIDHDLFTEESISNREEVILYKIIILRLFQKYPNIEKFEFLSLTKNERNRMYIILNELSIPYTKIRIDQNVAIINIYIYNVTRYNLNTYRTNNSYSIQKYKEQNNITNNMKKKLRIADIVFDIKDIITDSMFKELMDTLSEITD